LNACHENSTTGNWNSSTSDHCLAWETTVKHTEVDFPQILAILWRWISKLSCFSENEHLLLSILFWKFGQHLNVLKVTAFDYCVI
jgi:hypothetical protein